MARVTLGPIYSIVDFWGKRRGVRRVGGVLPPRWQQWARIHVLNMTPLTMHAAYRAVMAECANGRGLEGYALAGVTWALYGLAAESPAPGVLAARDGGLIAPLGDAEIAEALNMSALDWKGLVPRLLSRGGCGVLILGNVEIEVGDEEVPAYEQARNRQLELFNRPAADVFLSPARSGAAPVRANDTKTGCYEDDTTRNEAAPAMQQADRATRHDRVGSAAFEEPEKGDTVADPERRLQRLVNASLQVEALEAWLGIMEQRLKPGQANKADRSQWSRAFVRCWNRGRSEREPKRMAELRWAALRECLDEAAAIAIDPTTRNPASRMCDFLKRQGLADTRRA